MLARFFISFYFFKNPYCVACVREPACMCACLFFYFFILGKGLFGGTRRLRENPVRGSYEF